MISLGFILWDAVAVFSFLTTGVLSVGTAIIIITVGFKVKELIITMINKL